MFDKIDVPLIREHPDTGEIIPGLAEAWAEHQGMLWFRLNPSARYSNGRPVRAGDFALGACLREQAGDTVLGSVVVELHTYGDNVLAVKLRKEGFRPLLKAAKSRQYSSNFPCHQTRKLNFWPFFQMLHPILPLTPI